MGLSDLMDISELRELCRSFTSITGVATGIHDLDGSVLVETGGQDICNQFHRINSTTYFRDRESDTILAARLRKGDSCSVYQCKSGLVDFAVPITIAGEHVANFFTGQFFLEPPDKNNFLGLAREFGFDESAYIRAMEKVPLFSEEKVQSMIGFLTRLAKLIGEMGLSKLRLQQANTKVQAKKAIIQSSPDAIIGTSLDGVIQSWNSGAEKIFGYASSEVIGKPLEMLIPTDRAASEVGIFSKICRGERVSHFETIRRRKNARLINLSISISPILDETGSVIGTTQIARDITTRKELERDLQHRQIMMERTESMARLASFEWNIEADLVTWSPEMFRIFGRDPTLGVPNLEGQAELYTPASTKILFDAVNKAVSDGTPYELELVLVQAGGEQRHCFVKGFPERDDSGHVVRVAGLVQDITDRKRADDEIKQLAYHDSLTQLPNRRLLNDRLAQAMASSTRSENYGALMFVDLDNFKSLNDAHGHGAGDLLLIKATDRLLSCVREMDTVARFGGDEFVVMISELDTNKHKSTSQAQAIAEKIRAALSDPYRIAIKRGNEGEKVIEHQCTASVGVTLFIGNQSSPEDLLKWADDAMYQAKQDGRNLTRFHLGK